MRTCDGVHCLEYHRGRTVYHVDADVRGSVSNGTVVVDGEGAQWMLSRLLQIRDSRRAHGALEFRWAATPMPLYVEDASECRAYFPRGVRLAPGEAKLLEHAPTVGEVSVQCENRFTHIFPSRAAALAHFGMFK